MVARADRALSRPQSERARDDPVAHFATRSWRRSSGSSIDAGITYLENEPLGRVAQVPLYEETYRLLVSASSPLATHASVTWEDVAAQPLCLLTSDMQNRRIINQHLNEAGASVVPTVESNSSIALVAHVATGRWASIVTQTIADMFGKGSGLRAVPIHDGEARHLVGLIAAWREPHTPVIQSLLEEARRVAVV